jgi:hypothetical protein
MSIFRILTVSVFTLALVACAHQEPVVTASSFTAFREGQDCEQIIQAIGHAPTQMIRRHDGSRQFTYMTSQSQLKPESFIPVVGQVLGGGTATVTLATFDCDQTGKLLKSSFSENTQTLGPQSLGQQR